MDENIGKFKCATQKQKRGSNLMYISLIIGILVLHIFPLAALGAESPDVNAIEPNLSLPAKANLPATSELSKNLGTEKQDTIYSSAVAEKFYNIGYELGESEDVNLQQQQEAMVFFSATMMLDSKATYAVPEMIKMTSQFTEQNLSELVFRLLSHYVNKTSDLEISNKAVQYLLERLNSREERERLLQGLLKTLGGKNQFFDSELATLLGVLMVEKTDFKSAASYFAQAYNNNTYNQLAFSKLVELIPEQISATAYVGHLRFNLSKNPLNIESAAAFAQYCEFLQLYPIAAAAYTYTADLFGYLYPSRPLPSEIYIPWALSSYNTDENLNQCQKIAEMVRKSGRFDLVLEAIAAKALEKSGDKEQADGLLKAAEDSAISEFDSLAENLKVQSAYQLAWFFNFVTLDIEKGIDWANKAYSIDPNLPGTATMLAYSVAVNGQVDFAKKLLENYPKNQTAELAEAQIELAEGQKEKAIEKFKSAINMAAGTFEAKRAKEILEQNGAEYTAPMTSKAIAEELQRTFGQSIVPAFTKPDKIFSAKLTTRGSKFTFGSELGGNITITNNYLMPMVISEGGLFTGNIRIDAEVKGDVNQTIYNLVSTRIQPASAVEPGGSFIVPIKLDRGQLKKIMTIYPQASLEIEFTMYLDPVTTENGAIANRLRDLAPIKTSIKRSGVEFTGEYLRKQLDSLSKGRQGQKIGIVELFISLLKEQQAMANREPLYQFMYADWMPELLSSAIIFNLEDQDWVVKVQTMAEMVSLPLDYKLTAAVSANMQDTHWPVRLVAIYLLAKTQGESFTKVLEWSSQNDSSKIVQDMAKVLLLNKQQAGE